MFRTLDYHHLTKLSFCLGLVIVLLGLLTNNPSLLRSPRLLFHWNACEDPRYTVRVVSYHPLMIHLESFITRKERKHLQILTSPYLKRATVEFSNGSIQETSIRTSSTAILNATADTDPIVRCVVKRLADFQGFQPLESVEQLQVTAYAPGQHYGLHLDSLGNLSQHDPDRWSRTTTAFGVLDAQCEKCGTQFPRIKTNWSRESRGDWCRILDCDEKALTVNSIPGSVLFWSNLNSDGSPDWRTVHAGLPVGNGTKSGVNIWTRMHPDEAVIV